MTSFTDSHGFLATKNAIVSLILVVFIIGAWKSLQDFRPVWFSFLSMTTSNAVIHFFWAIFPVLNAGVYPFLGEYGWLIFGTLIAGSMILHFKKHLISLALGSVLFFQIINIGFHALEHLVSH